MPVSYTHLDVYKRQVAAYTVDNPEKQRQCIAYSLDKGRTFTKYEGNPVIDSKEMCIRDRP